MSTGPVHPDYRELARRLHTAGLTLARIEPTDGDLKRIDNAIAKEMYAQNAGIVLDVEARIAIARAAWRAAIGEQR